MWTSASNRSFRIKITRSDLLQANGNPRIMFKHLRMSRVANEAGQLLSTTLGMNRAQIIDYINEEAQKQVVSVGVATDASINTSGIITATSFHGDGSNLTGLPASGVGIATAGGLIGTGVTQLDFRGSGVSTVTTNSSSGISTINITGGGGSSYSDSDVDTHVNVSTANTDEILVYNGSDYEWKAPDNLGVTTATGVVRGFPTGVGNTTLRLVMTDSSLVDIDLTNLNSTSSVTDINSRITKAVSFARTETSYLRLIGLEHLIVRGMQHLGHLVVLHWVWDRQQILMFLMMVMHNHSHKLLSSETQVSILIETVF